MQQLHQWLEAQFALKQVEPNSGLGKAITYLLRHWKGLTAFLREAGAPLDNNVCERALKRAVLHRKNALFYRTLHGAPKPQPCKPELRPLTGPELDARWQNHAIVLLR
jgi:hypothetical protein